MQHPSDTLAAPKPIHDIHARSSSRTPSGRRQETDDSELAGRVWAREEEEDPWAPCILTLDGGGIRGYSSLLILKALMHQVWIWENVLEEEERSERSRSRRKSRGGNGDTKAGASLRLPPDLFPLQRQPDEDDGEEAVLHDSPIDETRGDHAQDDSSPKRTFNEEDLLPCHYFDFMYGTSTGGLIATILGRLRMTVDEGLELYRQVGDNLFGRKRSHLPLTTKYYHQPLERAVRDVVRNRCHEHPHCTGNDLHPWECETPETFLVPFDVDDPRVCQSCCLTATHDQSISEAYLLRTYPHHYSEKSPNWTTPYNSGADKLPIWVCTRATSAAPFYFEKVKAEVEGEMKYFMDGGIRENNPSGAALSEFHSLYYNKCKRPAVMLSIGTGRPDQSHDGFAGAWGPWGRLPFISKLLEKLAVIQNVLIKYTEGEKQHHMMREYAEGEHRWYKRLNVSDGLQHLPLDHWVKGEWQGKANVPGGETLTRMEDATRVYLEREYDAAVDSYAPPSTMLRQTAEKLVRQRRARERLGGVRWDTFAGKFLHQGKASVANGNGNGSA